MEPTDFEKWCAVEIGYGYSPEYIAKQSRTNSLGEKVYIRNEISIRYDAYMAGVRSRLPYQTQPRRSDEKYNPAND